MKDIVVIYHRADFDGLFCREIARRHFGETAEYIGLDYGEPAPRVSPDKLLFILDLSVPELMRHPRLVWIDHHKSAMRRYGARPGWQMDGVAACRLAWRWFEHASTVPDTTLEDFRRDMVAEPLAVTLVGKYDVWDKRDPWVDLFQLGLQSCDVEFQRLLSPGNGAELYAREILERGRPLQYWRAKSDKHTIETLGFTLEWEGLRFLACNSTRASSDLFTAGLKPEHQACLSFAWNGSKRQWKVSLRGVPTHPHLDLSVIASKFGGGGHKGACGFECATLPFSLGGAS